MRAQGPSREPHRAQMLALADRAEAGRIADKFADALATVLPPPDDALSAASSDSADGIAAAANERVVEDCLGTLRNLTEDHAGRAAVMERLEPAVKELVRCGGPPLTLANGSP
jgi:hypothetical protein